MEEPKYTHKGWFWFCPIYVVMTNPEEPIVGARSGWFEPLFFVADMFEMARVFLTTVVNPEYEPTFMFKITGEV